MTDVLGRLTSALADRYAIARELGAVVGVECFLSEIRVTAQLHHPRLPPLGSLRFDVHPDGQRFLFVRARSDDRSKIEVLLNWFDALRAEQ